MSLLGDNTLRGGDRSALTRPDLLSQLTAPFYVSHRGGPARFPEHSMPGYRESAAAGFLVEPDIAALADGTLVTHHDATVDRTTDGTGNVSSLTRAQWDALLVDPRQPNAVQARGAYWDRLLDEFGGRAILVPEPKSGDAAALARLLDSITQRGLHRSVVVQSFDYAQCAAAAQRGIAAAPLTESVAAAQMVTDGMWGVFVTMTCPQSYIDAAKAVGLKVVAWTVNNRVDAAAQFAKGVDGIFTDDAWWVSGRAVPQNSDPYTSRTVWPGAYTTDATRFGYGHPGEWGRLDPSSAAGWCVQNWAGVRAPSTGQLRVRFNMRFGTQTAADNSRWASVYIGTLNDGLAYVDGAAAGQVGYHFLLRRRGDLGIYKVADGAAATLLGASAVPGTPNVAVSVDSLVPDTYEIEINATDVLIKNLTRGYVQTVADTANRPPAKIAFGANGTAALFSNVRVLDL